MALPARLATLDELDEALHAHYERKGEEYVLQVDGIKEHPTVTGLQKAYDSEKERARERAEKLKLFGDLTPEDVTTLQEEIEELRENKGGDLITAEELKDLKERQKELTKRAKRADDLESELAFRDKDQRTRLKGEVRGELARAGVKKEAINAAAALLMTEYGARYDRTDDGFSPMVTGDLNGVPGDHALGEFVGEWVQGEGAVFLPPTSKGGSGADPNNRGGNHRDSGGVKTVQMDGTTVRVNPADVIAGKTVVQRQ